jgi:hypothetical protein
MKAFKNLSQTFPIKTWKKVEEKILPFKQSNVGFLFSFFKSYRIYKLLTGLQVFRKVPEILM